MPVIGRLDGQVEEILINPAGRRGQTGGSASANDAGAPGRPGERETDAPADGGRARNPREDEAERRPDALPVWLL